MLQTRIIRLVYRLNWFIILTLAIINPGQVFAFDSAPALCAGLGDVQSISKTGWESGLGSWTVGRHDVAVPGDFTTPDWAVIGSLPVGRPGNAAFVENVNDEELCNLETVNQTGALTLDSPEILIPSGTQVPRISVDHLFAIEVNWDGGNFKVSVNGGAFTLIPASVIEVNPYNLTLYPAVLDDGTEWNTNPLAGEEAYSGATYSQSEQDFFWIQSHINLAGIAGAGDRIRLRFDFGVDECFGDIGWYVDDVEFYSCSDENDDIAPKLTLIKDPTNDSGGKAAPDDFLLTVGGNGVSSGVSNEYAANTPLAINETQLSGYTFVSITGDAKCPDALGGTVTLAPGDDVTCTITNNDIQPTLTVVKTIINDNGGTVTDPNAFGLTINGNSVSDSVSNALNAGNYTVAEDGLDGYEASAWGGDCNANGSITLLPGQNATCTITNDDIQPTLKLIKTIINDNGGTVTDPNAFGLRIDGVAVLDSASNAVDAGNHVVSEDGLPDYTPGKWGGDCDPNGSISLALGQNATCTITNDDIDPFDMIFKDGFE